MIKTLDNPKLVKLLEEKELAVKEGREQYKVVEKEQQKLNKCGLKIQKYKDKIIPLVKELTKDLLGEYEDLSEVKLENGKVILTIVDKVEEFKKTWKEERAKYEQGTSQNPDPGAKTGTNQGNT
jgi:hypothetical protein